MLVVGEPGSGARRLAERVLGAGGPSLYLTATDRDVADATTRMLVPPADGESARTVDGDPVALADLPVLADDPERVLVDAASLAEPTDDPPAARRALAASLAAFEERDVSCLAVDETAEGVLSRRTGGVVACWREPVDATAQPFVRVRSLPGGVPDTRRYRLALEAETSVVPRGGTDGRELATGIESFDALAGGIVRDGTTVFEHDGTADHWPFTAALAARVIDRGAVLACLTAPGTLTARLDELLAPQIAPVVELTAEDSLYLVDTVSPTAKATRMADLPDENVVVQAEAGGLQESIRSLVTELTGQPVLAVLEMTPVLHLLDPDQARQLFYWASANVLARDGLSLVVTLDRTVAGEEMAAFLRSVAEQVYRTWRGEDGLQYLSVWKAANGVVGKSAVVESLAEPPFVRLR